MSSNNFDKPGKSIDLLFSKFAAFYGHVWRSQFKDEAFLRFAKKEWAEALNSFHDKAISDAILHCRSKYEFPPTLPQFIDLCTTFKKSEAEQTLSCKKPFQPARPEVAEYCLKQMRQRLTSFNVTNQQQEEGV